MKKKLITVLLTLALTASMLSACGGKEAPAPEAKEEVTEEADVAEEEDAEEPAETEDYEEETEEVADTEDADSDEGFSLLDVDESMVQVGVYGTDNDGTELVFTMFKGPDGNDYVSLFGFDNNEQSGDVICGTYDATTETDEEGDDWTYFTVSDVYTGNEFNLGIGERPETGEVVFFDEEGNVIEGEYLSEADTINYMGSAAALISQ
ncbi:MAG: hypothetical protein IJU25_00130 [Lachnospiraceae bacterium]|nr:hypothetical protein [Lachnospiraceae bacterium]